MCLPTDVTSIDPAAVNSVRLVGGDTLLEGRVEIFLLGQWGTVCDYNWDFSDATVVCRQLGYAIAVEAPRSAFFGAGSGPSWYYSVNCRGTELTLNQCSRSTNNFGSACSHSNDAGVVCSSESESSPCVCCLHLIGCLWLCACMCVCVCLSCYCLCSQLKLSWVLLYDCDTY